MDGGMGGGGGEGELVSYKEPPWVAFSIPFSRHCSSVSPTLAISGIVHSVSGAAATRSKRDCFASSASGKEPSAPRAAVCAARALCSFVRCAPAGDLASFAKNGSSTTSLGIEGNAHARIACIHLYRERRLQVRELTRLSIKLLGGLGGRIAVRLVSFV